MYLSMNDLTASVFFFLASSLFNALLEAASRVRVVAEQNHLRVLRKSADSGRKRERRVSGERAGEEENDGKRDKGNGLP